MDKTYELIKEILSREEGDVNAYLSAVLRVRGELPIKDGKIQCVRADSAFCDVIIDFINKARSIVKDSPVETGREGSGEAARFFFKMEGGAVSGATQRTVSIEYFFRQTVSKTYLLFQIPL